MKVAIMQPYFFPYIGYWQLIKSVDTFVIFDDVNFINKGYINRNNILLDGCAHRINLQLKQASQNKHINEIMLGDNREKVLQLISLAYKKAPMHTPVMKLLSRLFEHEDLNLARFLGYSIQAVCEYLGIERQFLYSSDIEHDLTLRGQNKIIGLCEQLGASRYINAIGGKDLYNRSDFLNYNIQLDFIKTDNISYPQLSDEFIGNLSIIDVLMFNNKQSLQSLMGKFELV